MITLHHNKVQLALHELRAGSGRPLLLLHPANDSVTPTEQSVELFQHARQPADLHLVADVDHFILSDENTVVVNLVKNWLEKYLPARGAH